MQVVLDGCLVVTEVLGTLGHILEAETEAEAEAEAGAEVIGAVNLVRVSHCIALDIAQTRAGYL